MKLTKAILFLCSLFCIHLLNAEASSTHTIKGLVITPDGIVVPKFSVVVKEVADRPELALRRHFTNGEFAIEGLEPGKYQVQIFSPLHVNTRLAVDLKPGDTNTDYNIVILHPFRNEARMVPGAAYAVSVKVLQQKIPSQARDAYLKGVELHRDGNLESALMEYGRALRSQPYYLEALTDIGTIFLLYNRPESALTFLRRAQHVDDCNPIINLNIAIAMSEQGDLGGAAKLLQGILKNEPRMAIAQLFLAKINYAQKKYSQADAYLRNALDNDPGLLDAWLLKSNISRARGDHEQAREALERLRDAMNSEMVTEFIDEQLLAMGN